MLGCLHNPGAVSCGQSLLGKLFVEALSYNAPGFLPDVHPAAVRLATALLVPDTMGGAVACPHPMCQRHDPAPKVGFDRWKAHFPEHYRRFGYQKGTFERCWAMFCLSDLLGRESAITPSYMPCRPFRPAERSELETLFRTLCVHVNCLCGEQLLRGLKYDPLGKLNGPPESCDTSTAVGVLDFAPTGSSSGKPYVIKHDNMVLANACRVLHCLSQQFC